MPYFSYIATAVFFALNLASYALLSPNTLFNGRKIILRGFFLALFLVETLYFFNIKSETFSGLVYSASVIAIGASFMIFCVALLYILLLFLARIFRIRTKSARFVLDSGVILAVFCYLFFGVHNALFTTRIITHNIPIKNLSKPLNIAVITDIHIGHFLKADFLKRAVDNINALSPDALFIVGDLADRTASDIAPDLAPLKELQMPIFMVLGNHEYYHGPVQLIELFRELGLRVLLNESVDFEGVNIAGALDFAGLKMGFLPPDFNSIYQNTSSERPLILLTHQPKSISLIKDEDLGRTDLIISGHTHNGQIFPFNLLVAMDQHFTKGLYELRSERPVRLLVSSGLGFWGPPMRIGSQSEILFLRLRPDFEGANTATAMAPTSIAPTSSTASTPTPTSDAAKPAPK